MIPLGSNGIRAPCHRSYIEQKALLQMDIQTLKERRNQLLTDMGKIALHKDGWNTERRTSFDKMDKDVQAVEADIARSERIESIEARGQEFTRVPRPGIATSTDERRSSLNRAFQSYMAKGHVDPEYRDLITTGSAGSLIPQDFLPELITAEKFYGPIAGIVKKKVTDGTGRPLKVAKMDDTANGLTLLATEGTSQPQETDPGFSNVILGADSLSTGLIKVSFESVADSQFDLGELISQSFGVRAARGIEKAITLGVDAANTPLPNMPTGGLAAAATVALTTSTLASGITYQNLVSVYGSLDTAYVQNASWTFHPTTRSYLLGVLDGFGRPLFQANPSTAEPFAFLLGAPVVLNSSMPQMGAGAQPIILSDFSRTFLLREDGPMSILKLSERYADTLEYGYFGWNRIAGAIIAPTSVTAIASLKQATS